MKANLTDIEQRAIEALEALREQYRSSYDAPKVSSWVAEIRDYRLVRQVIAPHDRRKNNG